ncbi:hypothetical protein Tco_0079172 [Tanacetum coccineum]
MRIRLTKQAANSVDKASCVSGRVLRLLIRSTLEAANPVRNSAGIDNEAASSMTRVAEDDETQRNKQKPIGVSQFTKNFDVWEFGTVLRWHYGKDHGNAVEDRQYEVDFAMGITGIFCCKSGRSCAGAEAIQSNELLSTKVKYYKMLQNCCIYYIMFALVESASHIFFSCSLALQVRSKLMCWWELDNHVIHPYEDWFCRFNGLRMSKGLKEVFEDVCYVMSWLLWRFKNLFIFGEKLP